MSDAHQPGRVPPPPGGSGVPQPPPTPPGAGGPPPPGRSVPPPPPSGARPPAPPAFPSAPAPQAFPPAPAPTWPPSAAPTYPAAGPGAPGAPYAPYAGSGPERAPAGLRRAAIVLFWLAAAAELILGLVAYGRGNVARDIRNGVKSGDDLDKANNAVGGALVIWILVSLAAVIVVAIWSYKTVRNAKRRDPASNASPGLAAGGWFIPIGNYWVPWQQLRTSAKRLGMTSGALTAWQVLYVASSVLFVIARVTVGGDVLISDDNAVSKLHAQGILFTISGMVLVAAALAATMALGAVDRATSGQPAS